MGKHRLTVYVEVLNEKANTCNKYALCKACIDKVSHEYAYTVKGFNYLLFCLYKFIVNNK